MKCLALKSIHTTVVLSTAMCRRAGRRGCHLCLAPVLVVGVEALQRAPANAKVGQQFPRVARVLRQDQVGVPQHAQRAQRDVLLPWQVSLSYRACCKGKLYNFLRSSKLLSMHACSCLNLLTTVRCV